MYNPNYMYPFPYPMSLPSQNPYPPQYFIEAPRHNPDFIYPSYHANIPFQEESVVEDDERGWFHHSIKDYGPEPYVVNIEKVTSKNNTFRTALWSGKHLQVTLMSINVGEDIGLEVHPHLDQFIRIEQGNGLVKMGDTKQNLDFQRDVADDFAIVIPAGKWHNLINTGNRPLKLYSIYAPPQHPHGTVHRTKAEAEAAEHH
ncbi:cupin domain-containing protein [Saliterribacillus persicus]|uniref:Mannose-6-phosphate isomerase-like protein (Cupin superfamily) n=1 Tax=Saliterribacillus persicus TaxID=930114 RepID=A0A368X7H0_9BACI|nr:cupin domain-containing protein [Saliterribacillus persicus]RCW63903.1 mannose-6-phosphate isomerase-like protein (cupin superfamily) [Saliterribacillus persicus]